MSSQLAVPESTERSIRRQPSATRITVSTVRPTAPPQPTISIDSNASPALTESKDKDNALPISVSIKTQPTTKTRKAGSKLRARRRAYGAQTYSEGEESDEASDQAVSEDEDEDDAEDDDDDASSSGDSSDEEDNEEEVAVTEAAPADAAAAVAQTTAGPSLVPTSIDEEHAVTSDDGGAAEKVASLPAPSSSDATSSTAGKLSWAAIAEADDDEGEMEALEEELAAEAAAMAAAKVSRAAAVAPSPTAPTTATAPATPSAAALAAKERKKLKAKERKLRKKAELAAAAAGASDAKPKAISAPAQPAKSTQPVKSQPSATKRAEEAAAATAQAPTNPKAIQDNYRDRLTKDPTYTPRLGNFWGHDERLIDGDLRKLSGWWRGRGGVRGGMGGARGGRGGSHAEARASSVAQRESEQAPSAPGTGADASAQNDRIPPHLRQAAPSGRGGISIRGAAGAAARGGRAGARGAFASRALGAGAFGAYAPGPAPPGRSKLRGWDDEEDYDDSASTSDAPKVDYDALEGKAVKEPSRAARPPPQPSRSSWADETRDKSARPVKPVAAVKGSGPTLSGVPTAPRAMLKAAAEAAAATEGSADQAQATQSNGSTAASAAPEHSDGPANQGLGGKWAHDGFAELQKVETRRGSKRAARGGLAGAAGRGGSAVAGRNGPRAMLHVNDPTGSPSGAASPVPGHASPGDSVSSPHRVGVPLDGKDGVFVSQSASRSNSVAGRDSPVVFGSVHGSAAGDDEKSINAEYNPRAASFLLAQGSGKDVSVRLPAQQPHLGRPAGPQQVPSSDSVNSSQASYPTHPYLAPNRAGQASSIHSAASGTPPPYPMAPPMPVTMAPTLPPGFAVDSTGMVFNLTGGQPVAVGYLPPMPTVGAAPMGTFYPGYADDAYAGGSPAPSVYQPSPHPATSSASGAPKPSSSPVEPSRISTTSPVQARTSPTQAKKEAPRALPPHMQQAGSTRSSVLGKHARTISTLPASAATVPAFRPSGSPAPLGSSPAGSDAPRYAPQIQSHQQQHQHHQYQSLQQRHDQRGAADDGQALLEHAMSQVQLGERNGYANHVETGNSSPYGLDAYAAQISPPMGTVYFQPPPVADAYGANAYAAQGYGSPAAYYGGQEMYDSDPSFFAAAYDHQ
ncbi:hypothetical protein OC834_003566 [Tilletia horrida]|nr:hypothetical protein OC834_003566 [Tilletia horrida]